MDIFLRKWRKFYRKYYQVCTLITPNFIQGDVTRARVDYETILEEKLALDTEIAVYKGLIKAEESRLARASKREAQEEERKNESSSDKESNIENF